MGICKPKTKSVKSRKAPCDIIEKPEEMVENKPEECTVKEPLPGASDECDQSAVACLGDATETNVADRLAQEQQLKTFASSATSCAGMTDAGSVKSENQHDVVNACLPEEPQNALPEHESDHGNDIVMTQEKAHEGEINRVQSSEVTRKEAHVEAVHELPTPVFDAPPPVTSITDATAPSMDQQTRTEAGNASGDIYELMESVDRVKRGLSKGYEQIATSKVGEAIGRATTGDFSDFQPFEECISGFLGDICEYRNTALPCIAGHDDGATESILAASGITMVVDTPAGPYVRHIPEALIDDAIMQGLITREDVQKQRPHMDDVVYDSTVSLAA